LEEVKVEMRSEMIGGAYGCAGNGGGHIIYSGREVCCCAYLSHGYELGVDVR